MKRISMIQKLVPDNQFLGEKGFTEPIKRNTGRSDPNRNHLGASSLFRFGMLRFGLNGWTTGFFSNVPYIPQIGLHIIRNIILVVPLIDHGYPSKRFRSVNTKISLACLIVDNQCATIIVVRPSANFNKD